MKTLFSLILGFVLIPPLHGQAPGPIQGVPSNAGGVQTTTISIASSFQTQGMVRVTNGASTTDCTTGGGTSVVICYWTGSVWSNVGGSSAPGFNSLTSGTNTSAAMLVGTGASLAPAGSGTLSANQVNGAAPPTSKTIVGTNSSGQIVDASSATLANSTTGNAATATDLASTGSNGQFWGVLGGAQGWQNTLYPVVYPESNGALGNAGAFFDGAVTASSYGDATATAGSTAAAAPSVTTTINNSAVISIFSVLSGWSSVPSTGTNRVNAASSTGLYGFYVNDQVVATAGVVPAVSGTLSSSSNWDAISVYLGPSPSLSFVGSNFVQKAAGTGNVVVNKPAGVSSGNLVIGCITYWASGANTIVWPTGFNTSLGSFTGTGSNILSCKAKTAGVSEPSTYSWGQTQTGGTALSAFVVVYSGIGGTTLTSATANFTSSSVGYPICMQGGSATLAQICGTITAYASSTSVTVSPFMPTASTGVWLVYGADDTTAWLSTISSAPCGTTGCTIMMQPHAYMLTGELALPVNIPIDIRGVAPAVSNTADRYVNGNSLPNTNNGSRLFYVQGNYGPGICICGSTNMTSTTAHDELEDFTLYGGAGINRDGGGGDGIDILNWSVAALHHVFTWNFSGSGVYLDTLANTAQNYTENIAIDGLYSSYNYGDGVKIGGTGDGVITTTHISNSNIEANGGPGVGIAGGVNTYGVLIDGSTIQWNNANAAAAEIYIGQTIVNGCVIQGNAIEINTIAGSKSNAPFTNTNGVANGCWIGPNSWTGSATAVPAGILAESSKTAQTGSVSSTTLFTTPSVATSPVYATPVLFADIYLSCTTGQSTTTVGVTLGWTDESGTAQSLVVIPTSSSCATTGLYYTASQVMHSAASSAVTYSTTAANFTTGAYAINVRLRAE